MQFPPQKKLFQSTAAWIHGEGSLTYKNPKVYMHMDKRVNIVSLEYYRVCVSCCM